MTTWKTVLLGLLAALIVVALIAGIVWNGEHDRLSRERLGRDCIAAGGTWSHGDCLMIAGAS